ncbi:membrane dipeptidase [Leadbettera azotonutricia ZAS-9]|uniref:Membrane dipeptidase n=2 Tax=Leadbettera azotonutricia TaxID=150829 RepID=F5Y912_LEAAZ|nr:membrane dipeptidase [Leadbettera azotonutricia ZAS-9]
MHCDTLMTAYQKKREDIFTTDTMLDIKRLKEYGAMAQFFAIFMPGPGSDSFANAGGQFPDDEYIAYCLKVFENALVRHSDSIAQALTGNDVVKNSKAGKTSAILSFEDGRPIAGRLENLDAWHQKGIRLITLTWNGENCFGFPNSLDKTEMAKGLKPFGKEAILCMNELGIIIDVSHISAGGFFDVAELSKKPFVASHSNSYTLSPHQRNLTDEQIKLLADAGGVTGLNFAAQFLNADIECKKNTAALISAHAKYIKKIGGIDCVGLGSDFDGIEGELEIGKVQDLPLLFDQFSRDGFTDDEIERIAWKNTLRVMTDILG